MGFSPPHRINKDGIEEKQCSKCCHYKVLDEFYNNNGCSDGKMASCKDCQREVRNNPEKRVRSVVRNSRTITKVKKEKRDKRFFESDPRIYK